MLLIPRDTHFRVWFVPMLYAGGALLVSFTVPRLADNLLPGFVSSVSVNAAIGFYSAIASGMIALTAIVFSLTFVMVQFSATAYSPRHSLGLIGVAQAGFPFQAYSWWAYFSLSAS